MVLIFTNLDKIILSKMLTLTMFGYYTLAGVAAMSLYRLIPQSLRPVYPRFTQLVAQGDQAGLTELYHRGCQLMSVLILPAALVAACFPGNSSCSGLVTRSRWSIHISF